MYPMIPGDFATFAIEMMCYFFTATAAYVSCPMTLRF